MMFVVLSGCAAIKTPIDEGYQFGDTTSSIVHIQAKYCAETDPVQRAILLTVIKSAVPTYPERGACSNLVELVGEDAVKDMAEEVPDLEIEKSIEEQKNYQDKVSQE